MTQDPNMMYVSTYGPYHVHTWYIHLYALKGYTGVYTCIYTCAYNMYMYMYMYMCTCAHHITSCHDITSHVKRSNHLI